MNSHYNWMLLYRLYTVSVVQSSVLDSNTLYMDPYPEICPNLYLDPKRIKRLQEKFAKICEKNLKNYC